MSEKTQEWLKEINFELRKQILTRSRAERWTKKPQYILLHQGERFKVGKPAYPVEK